MSTVMRPDQLQLGFLKVLKGSYMQEMQQEYELRYKDEPPYEVLSTKWLPYSDVIELKGIEEKIQAATECGAIPVIIGRPVQEKGISVKRMQTYAAREIWIPADTTCSSPGNWNGKQGNIDDSGQ